LERRIRREKGCNIGANDQTGTKHIHSTWVSINDPSCSLDGQSVNKKRNRAVAGHMPKKIDEERDKMTKKDVLTSNFIDLGAALSIYERDLFFP